MPLWTALLSVPLLHEPFTLRRMLGVGFGTASMLLIGSDLAALKASPAGALLVIGAAISWALGTIAMKRFPTELPTTSFSAWQLLLGAIPIAIAALVCDAGKLHPP